MRRRQILREKYYLCPKYKIYAMDKKNVIKEKANIFQRMLEDKRAIRRCIQKGEDLKKLAEQRGIKFATPL